MCGLRLLEKCLRYLKHLLRTERRKAGTCPAWTSFSLLLLLTTLVLFSAMQSAFDDESRFPSETAQRSSARIDRSQRACVFRFISYRMTQSRGQSPSRVVTSLVSIFCEHPVLFDVCLGEGSRLKVRRGRRLRGYLAHLFDAEAR